MYLQRNCVCGCCVCDVRWQPDMRCWRVSFLCQGCGATRMPLYFDTYDEVEAFLDYRL